MKLQAKNLTKKYLGKVVVDRLNITLKPGEILGLLGPNGAGKTTFFYMIAGLIRSDSGKILIDEEDVTDKINIIYAKDYSLMVDFNLFIKRIFKS